MKLGKISKLIVVSGLFLSANALNASAGQVSANSNLGFGSAWQRYASGDSGRANLTYGYNTAFFNEDYAHAKHSTQQHVAIVNNGNGEHKGSWVSAGGTSKIEVRHEGSAINYKNFW